jgi:phosphate transport system protein
MAEQDARLLSSSLGAFHERDAAQARAIWLRDEEIDALYREVYRALLLSMLSSAREIEKATHLTWVAHNSSVSATA